VPQITILGEACLDVELCLSKLRTKQKLVNTYRVVPGGSAGNVAMTLKSYGVGLRLYTPSGGDYVEKILKEMLDSLRMADDVVYVRGSGQTCLVTHVVSGSRRYVYTYRGPTHTSLKSVLNELDLKHTRIFHISGYGLELFPDNEVRDFINIVKNSGVTLSFDLFPRIDLLSPEFVKYLLQNVDLLFGNELEFKILSDLLEGLTPKTLSVEKPDRHVIVKMGGRGACLYIKGRKHCFKPPKVRVVSSRGAGDVLVATFLKDLLIGVEAIEALSDSVEVASQHVAGEGPLNKFIKSLSNWG